MRFSAWSEKRGVLLVMMGAVATVWLAATGKLSLYIHPRYIAFSVGAGLAGLAVSAWSLQTKIPTAARHSISSLAVLVMAAGSLLIVKPSVLSSSVANQRGLNISTASSEQPRLPNPRIVQLFANNDFNQLSIKEWATLLDQTSDIGFFAGKQATVTGFITPDQSDAGNVFFVSRFVIRCCAVDAQPVGVPVYLPDWQKKLKPDDWVTLSGTFDNNPSAKSTHRIVITPDKVTSIPQPKDAYVY
jgi:uncharacterized repeat protein (TIGR03943 family)